MGGHSGGIFFFFWGGAQSLRGSVATEGQGRRCIFRIGGGGKSYKNVKNCVRKICNITLCAHSAPKNRELCMFSIILMLNLMVF